MPDSLVAASNLEAGVALVAAITTDLVAEIRNRHDLWPTATAAVGRLATGAALFSASLKGNERISLQIAGDGPLGSLAADAWLLDEHTAGARGYARNGRVELPIDARGKFDVAGAIGDGSLQVTRSSDIGQPYVGVVPLQSGEIAEDLAVYLAQSEQIPSIVALGVLANPSGVVAAGGILARALPGADERALASSGDASGKDASGDAAHRTWRGCGRIAARACRRRGAAFASFDRRTLRLPVQSRKGRSASFSA